MPLLEPHWASLDNKPRQKDVLRKDVNEWLFGDLVLELYRESYPEQSPLYNGTPLRHLQQHDWELSLEGTKLKQRLLGPGGRTKKGFDYRRV